MANFNGLMGTGVPPNQPSFLLILKGVVLILSLVVLGVAAYNLSLFEGLIIGTTSGPAGFMIFDSIKTLLTVGITVFLEIKLPQNYYRPLILVLYALNLIFWLSAWAWCASVARLILTPTCVTSFGFKSCAKATGLGRTYGATLAALAGIGALIWVLMIVITALFVKACIKEDPNATYSQRPAEMGVVGGTKENSQPYLSTTEQVPQVGYGPQSTPYPSHNQV